MYMLSLQDAVRSQSPLQWLYADHFVPQLKHCWLRNVNKHALKAGQGAPGMGHWLYTLPTAPFTKVANGPFKLGGCNTGLGLHPRVQAICVANNFLEPNRRARHHWMPLVDM